MSAKLAFRAKRGEPSVWAASGFEALENYVSTTLNASQRAQLKLLNPLGVGATVAERQLTAVRDRRALLKDDFATLEQVEDQLAMYQRDMERDFELRMADVENVLLEMERRGHHFFDDTMRIGRVMDLLNRSRVQEAFERQVVADAPQQIERKVSELIDWLIDSDLRHWQGVTGHLAKRRQQYAGQIIDNPDTERFHFDRRRMIDSVGREAQQVVDGYDRQKEASDLADGARNAVATAAAVGAGAVGLGAIVTVAASTAAADVTGLVMASVLAAIGFFVIPAKRKKGKDEMRQKIAEVRETARQRAAGSVQERDREEHRTDSRQHRALQPFRARRRGEARRNRERSCRRGRPSSRHFEPESKPLSSGLIAAPVGSTIQASRPTPATSTVHRHPCLPWERRIQLPGPAEREDLRPSTGHDVPALLLIVDHVQKRLGRMIRRVHAGAAECDRIRTLTLRHHGKQVGNPAELECGRTAWDASPSRRFLPARNGPRPSESRCVVLFSFRDSPDRKKLPIVAFAISLFNFSITARPQ